MFVHMDEFFVTLVQAAYLAQSMTTLFRMMYPHQLEPSWETPTQAQKWTKDKWSTARCYINVSWYDQKTNEADIDCQALLQGFINNQYFHSNIFCNFTGTSLFSKILDHRNMIFHSFSQELEQVSADSYINDTITFLLDGKEQGNHKNSQQAVQKHQEQVKKLCLEDFPENEQTDYEMDKAGKITIKTSRDPIHMHDEDCIFQKYISKNAKYEMKNLKVLPICMSESQVFDFCLSPDIYRQICRKSRYYFYTVMNIFGKIYFWLPGKKIKQDREKVCMIYSYMKTEKRCLEMLRITEWISNCYKHTFTQLPEQLQHCYLPDFSVKLIDSHGSFRYFELEVKHIDSAYISALTCGKIIAKKVLEAWLNRLTFKSLYDKDKAYDINENHKRYKIELKMTNNNDDLRKAIKSDSGPTVCVHGHVNDNHLLECIGDNFVHLYPKTSMDFPNTVLSKERTSSVTINQRLQHTGITVDLNSQRHSLQPGENKNSLNEDGMLKEGDMEKEFLKIVVCHGNRMLSGNSNIIIFPASGNGKGISEQPSGTNNTLNDDDDNSSVSNRNSSSIRDEAVPYERISSSNHKVDGHTFIRGASNVAGTDGFSTEMPNVSKLKVNGQEKCPRVTEQKAKIVVKTENFGEISSTIPSQISESRNVPEFPANDLPNPEVERAELQRFEPLMQIIDKIADGERVPPQITMRYEMLRFCTLRSFPKHNKPFITRLAAAGFYYANTDDEVVCYSCARRKRNWCEDDNPMEIHRQLNPNCSFLLKNSEVNVPVRMSEIHHNSIRTTHSRSRQNITHAGTASTCSSIPHNTSTSISQSEVTSSHSIQNIKQTLSSPGNLSSSPGDSTGNKYSGNRMHQRAYDNFVQTTTPSPGSVAQQLQINHPTFSGSSDDIPVVNQSSAIPKSQLSIGGNNISTGPKYPKYAAKTARLISFNDCGDIVIPPDNLATSGFFYAGFGDCVRCFQCGVGLRHWSDEDDPWIEHCRWSKDCLFVKQVKGQEFVNLVQMAVQYSQNTTSGNITGTNTSEDAVIEQQMHTNAAQSVLEMGYDPNVIRIAIRALKNENDGQTLTAATLMEKIFELEDEALHSLEHSQLVQGTPPSQQNTRSAQNTDSNNTQRVSLDTSSASSNNVKTQSVSFDDASSSAGSLIQKTSKAQSKKSQLLEQQKLKQENEQLKQQSICTKCKTNDVCIVFLPCGHLVTCETCAPTVRYCSVQDCGKYIKGTVRTYLA